MLFKSAALMSVLVIMFTSWQMYNQLNQSRSIESSLFQVQTSVHDLLFQQDLFILEKQRADAIAFNTKLVSLRQDTAQLSTLLIESQAQLARLTDIQNQVELFGNSFNQMSQIQAQLGYSSDEGVSGSFRRQVHSLQAYTKQSQLPDIELKILELRRAEKDYLLRLEPQYLEKHNQLFNTLRTRVAQLNLPVLPVLESYREGFQSYIALLKRQGIDHKSGIWGELEAHKNSIRHSLSELNNIVLERAHSQKQNLVFGSLMLIVLMSLLGYAFLSALYNREAKNVRKISKVIKRACHEDFSCRTGLIGEEETAQIGQDLDELLDYIESLLQRLQAIQTRLVEEAKAASLGNIVNSFAHELNTPLGGALHSHSHLSEHIKNLKTDIGEGKIEHHTLSALIDDAELALHVIENNLSQSSQLVEDFKSLANAQQYDEESEFNLLSHTQQVINNYSEELASDEFKVTLDIPPDLNVVSLPSVLDQVLALSINNSINHGKVPATQLHIMVSAMVVNEYIHIYIKDDGAGIDSDILPIIFEPFITSKSHAGGTGLGMSIIYNLVTQKLKGEVKMQSPAHGGACLHIILNKTKFYFSKKQAAND